MPEPEAIVFAPSGAASLTVILLRGTPPARPAAACADPFLPPFGESQSFSSVFPFTCLAQGKRSYKMRHLTSIITVGSVETAVSRLLKLQVRFKPADNLLKVLSCIDVVMTGTVFLMGFYAGIPKFPTPIRIQASLSDQPPQNNSAKTTKSQFA